MAREARGTAVRADHVGGFLGRLHPLDSGNDVLVVSLHDVLEGAEDGEAEAKAWPSTKSGGEVMASERRSKAVELLAYSQELQEAGNGGDDYRELLRRKLRKILGSSALDFRFGITQVAGLWFVIDRDEVSSFGPFDSESQAEQAAEEAEAKA